ncbi:Sec61beta family-domain-containing protein [Boletus coccyginus]|nr:Sec61beta family-domain-containing protein [Boletus coccyginus]
MPVPSAIPTVPPRHHLCEFEVVQLETMSDSDASTRANSPSNAKASAVARPPGAQIRRRAAGPQVSKPNSTRAAGAGGSSGTMLKLYTDDSPGLRVDPFVVVILSLAFIGSIFFLHISAKLIRVFAK